MKALSALDALQMAVGLRSASRLTAFRSSDVVEERRLALATGTPVATWTVNWTAEVTSVQTDELIASLGDREILAWACINCGLLFDNVEQVGAQIDAHMAAEHPGGLIEPDYAVLNEDEASITNVVKTVGWTWTCDACGAVVLGDQDDDLTERIMKAHLMRAHFGYVGEIAFGREAAADVHDTDTGDVTADGQYTVCIGCGTPLVNYGCPDPNCPI